MSGRTIEELESHIRERLVFLEQQREGFVAQANAQIVGMNITIAELKEMIGEGEMPVKPDAPAEEEKDDPGDGPPTE